MQPLDDLAAGMAIDEKTARLIQDLHARKQEAVKSELETNAYLLPTQHVFCCCTVEDYEEAKRLKQAIMALKQVQECAIERVLVRADVVIVADRHKAVRAGKEEGCSCQVGGFRCSHCDQSEGKLSVYSIYHSCLCVHRKKSIACDKRLQLRQCPAQQLTRMTG
jgi:hypothetical protein